MVKIKDMEKFVDTNEQDNAVDTNEEVNVDNKIKETNTNNKVSEQDMINEMFGIGGEEEGNNKELELDSQEELQDKKGNEEEKQEMEEQQEDTSMEDTDTLDKNEGTGQDGGDVEGLIDELLSAAEDIGGEEVDKAAQEVQDAIDEGAPEDEVLKKLSELEDALANETMANEALSKERDKLLAKLNELQDRLSEYELNAYELKPVQQAMENDPTTKATIKVLAMYVNNPDKVGKEKLINVLDNFITNEFGVSVSDLLNQKAEEEKKKMTTGQEQQPIEITVDTGDGNPIDEMFDI